MFFAQFLSLFVVLLTLGQCQRTISDDLWVWGDSSSSNQNPSIRTTRPPDSVSTTQSTQFTTPNRKNQPSPRTCPGCPKTPQFNPVCGSDMATYDNPTAVSCANMCGPKIEILFYAACQPTA